MSDVANFLHQYTTAQRLQIGKLTKLKYKDLYSTGATLVLAYASKLDTLPHVLDMLEKVGASMKVPKRAFLIFQNPEWFVYQSIMDALVICKSLEAKTRTTNPSTNVITFTPKS